MLIILDGFGEGKKYPGNAVWKAKTPYIDFLRKNYPTTLLQASGQAAGLPKGVMGASEPGHVTLGAGRIVWQPLEEIDRAIQNGSFFKKKELTHALAEVKKKKSNLHLIGMISDSGVHSQLDHLFALLELAKKKKVKNVYIHAITDGRDVEEKSAAGFLDKIQRKIKKLGIGEITTIIGRYYAMDRDTNWNRTKKAYNLLTKSEGKEFGNYSEALKDFYKHEPKETCTDYYLKPVVLQKKSIQDKDVVIFYNFRSDRARQLTSAFVDKNFKSFKRKKIKTHFVCMGPYSKKAPVVFPAPKIKNNLAEVLSRKGVKQLRIAETEKYAHVTFFFNSQIEKPWPGEDRILIPSPKVPSYAKKPEMSAHKVTKRVLKEIDRNFYDVIILNFANPDLVGHSGSLKAAIKACEVMNQCVEKIVKKVLNKDGQVILTADHGNAEEMIYYGTKEICPAHNTNPVLCTVISEKIKKIKKGKTLGLKNIAPTLLDLAGIKKPKEMTGESLTLRK